MSFATSMLGAKSTTAWRPETSQSPQPGAKGQEGGRRTVFPFGLDLDEYFFLAHDLDDFAYIAAGFLEELEFLAQEAYACVEGVALGLEAAEVLGL